MVMETEGEQAKIALPTLEELLYDEEVKGALMLSDFSLHDPLFQLKGPVEEIHHDTDFDCPECSKFTSKKTRKYWYSHTYYIEGSKFCGHSHYGECIEETRSFPGSKMRKRYPICSTCLKKLFLKDLFDEYTAKVQEKEKAIKSLKDEFSQCQKEYTELKTSYDQQKREIKTRQKRNKQDLNELEIKISNARKEQREIEQEQERIDADKREAVKNEREINEKFDVENTKLENMYVVHQRTRVESGNTPDLWHSATQSSGMPELWRQR